MLTYISYARLTQRRYLLYTCGCDGFEPDHLTSTSEPFSHIDALS